MPAVVSYAITCAECGIEPVLFHREVDAEAQARYHDEAGEVNGNHRRPLVQVIGAERALHDINDIGDGCTCGHDFAGADYWQAYNAHVNEAIAAAIEGSPR